MVIILLQELCNCNYIIRCHVIVIILLQGHVMVIILLQELCNCNYIITGVIDSDVIVIILLQESCNYIIT